MNETDTSAFRQIVIVWPKPSNQSFRRIFSHNLVKAVGLVALLLLMPVIQVSVHALKGSGFLMGLAGMQHPPDASRVAVGVLINERDNMSYASWAEQAKLRHIITSDLYTTEPHPEVYFNPYFATVGVLSRVLNSQPYIMMILLSILSAVFFPLVVFAIGRQVGLGAQASIAAAVVTMYCSGPSWILYLLHATLGFDHTAGQRPFLGTDGFYFDIFPVTIFLVYPFSSFNLLVVAVTVLLINRAVICARELAWRKLLPAVAFCACAALVRPYDALLFCGLLPLCIAYRERGLPGFQNATSTPWAFSVWTGALLLPFCAYIVFVARLPVWRDFATSSLSTGPSRFEMIIGFSVLWLFAACGLYRAYKEQNVKLLFLGAWSISLFLLILGFGGEAARFLSGSVLALGILTTYGLAGFCRRAARGREWKFKLGSVLVASTVLTSAFDYVGIFIQPVPTIDAEIARQASAIPIRYGGDLPVVLMGCHAGLYLPGIAGLRVFAGHWSLTPDYKTKCRLLDEAGLDAQHYSLTSDTNVLLQLVREARPNYIIVPTASAAEAQLLANGTGKVFIAGRRWSTLTTSPEASP